MSDDDDEGYDEDGLSDTELSQRGRQREPDDDDDELLPQHREKRARKDAPQQEENVISLAEEAAFAEADDARGYYISLRDQWLRSGRKPSQALLDEFGYQEENIDILTPDDVNRKAHELTVEVSRAEIALEDESINYRDPRDVFWFDHIVKDGEAARNFDKIRHCIENMRTALLNLIQINQYMQNGELAAKTEDLLRQHEERTRMGDKDVHTRAILYFLNQAHQRKLRKSKSSSSGKSECTLYEPITIGGKATVSYRKIGTLSEWLYEMSRADKYMDVFAQVCKFMSSIETYIENTPDIRMPFYEVNRDIHGFENGFVNVDTAEVFFYDDNPDVVDYVAAHHHSGKYLKREWFEPQDIEYDIFDQCFKFEHVLHNGKKWTLEMPMMNGCDEPPPMHIPMPYMYELLRFQEFEPITIFWFFALIGRMLVPVTRHDTFGTIVLTSGENNTGKSTILNHVRTSLFPNQDRVAILSSNKEETFGLQTCYNKDAMFCDEMEKKPKWNLGELKSIATGGWMSIARKNNDPVFTRWLSCVLMSSNYKVPDWGTGSNDVFALIRRFAPFHFGKTVTNPDAKIEMEISKTESENLFATCLLCYHYLVKNVAKSGFNKIGPPQCLKALREMLIQLHPMVAFLETSGLLEFAPEGCEEDERTSYYVTMTELHKSFKDFCADTNIKFSQAWISEFYRAPLMAAHCDVTTEKITLPYPYPTSATTSTAVYVRGCRLADTHREMQKRPGQAAAAAAAAMDFGPSQDPANVADAY